MLHSFRKSLFAALLLICGCKTNQVEGLLDELAKHQFVPVYPFVSTNKFKVGSFTAHLNQAEIASLNAEVHEPEFFIFPGPVAVGKAEFAEVAEERMTKSGVSIRVQKAGLNAMMSESKITKVKLHGTQAIFPTGGNTQVRLAFATPSNGALVLRPEYCQLIKTLPNTTDTRFFPGREWKQLFVHGRIATTVYTATEVELSTSSTNVSDFTFETGTIVIKGISGDAKIMNVRTNGALVTLTAKFNEPMVYGFRPIAARIRVAEPFGTVTYKF